jgi:hypothetical protein
VLCILRSVLCFELFVNVFDMSAFANIALDFVVNYFIMKVFILFVITLSTILNDPILSLYKYVIYSLYAYTHLYQDSQLQEFKLCLSH